MEAVIPAGITPNGMTEREAPVDGRARRAAYNVFAYRNHDRASDVRKGELPEWNLHRLQEWIVRNDFDVVLIEKSDTPARGTPDITHHFDCSDSTCPGGC